MNNTLNLRLELPDADAKINRVLEGLKETSYTAKDAVEEMARILVRYMKIEAPVGTYWDLEGNEYQGGSLRDSLMFRAFSRNDFALEGGGAVAEILALQHYKYTIPPGTPPHPIFPREKPFLVFYWPKAQKVMVRKAVSHPGYAGDAWHQRALANASGEMRSAWEEKFKQWRIKVFM